MSKRLYRSRKNKMIGGVCGGIAEYFDIDPVIVRALVVIATFGYGIGFLAYIVLWIIVPERQKVYLNNEKNAYIESEEEEIESEPSNLLSTEKRKIGFGIALIAIGMLFFIDNFIPDIQWSYIFPLIIIGIGVYIISKSQKTKIGGGYDEND